MGNRKQPFGYRVVMGEIALHPQESKLVEYIFQQYLAGATYNTLVWRWSWLRSQERA